MKNVEKVIRSLKKEYSVDFFAEKHDRDPFKVLISCIISLRTKDEVTYPASKRLFKLADTPKKMRKLTEKQIAKAIYPAGFYKTKAKRIKQIAKQLYENQNSKVPDSIEELMEFKGVGRKTANIVMVFGFNEPAVPVDVHVHKLSNRLGWVKTKTPEQTEQELRKNLPLKYWLVINELFVRHGQQICFTRNPRCNKCKINKYCKRINVRTKHPLKR
ncbi:endonuclease III [Candidatus Woesearchaeota archaeon RBG_13_36_6]|nr:MAG: endonuclease III [Candidatus Woesearchaeota archaeon RBG_13_36_6]